jgi:DNA-directed RNA polymerase specialized sigma24 family protein
MIISGIGVCDMTVSVKDWPASPLDAVDTAFAALTGDPQPLSLDLDSLGPGLGLPAGVMTLPALRTWLLAHPRAYPARDAVWRELIRRARLDGPAWVIAAVALAMPALRRFAGRLCRGWAGDPDDLDAELLTGFLEALRDRVDLGRDAPHAALLMTAWRAGLRLRGRDGEQPVPVANLEQVTGPRTPRLPYGHPDVLIRRAVRLGILEPDDEQPYIDVRLGRRAIEPIAAALGVNVDALRRRLGRIDTRLAEALDEGLLTGAVSSQVAATLRRQAARRGAIRAAVRTEPLPVAA